MREQGGALHIGPTDRFLVMLHSAQDPQAAIAHAIVDAHQFAQDGRPCFGQTVLQQALTLAQREQQAGQARTSQAVAQVEAEIRRYRPTYPLPDL